jgi:drug/metabolite transporter (DMT)-like permease
MVFIGFILAIHFSLWITSLKLTSVSSSVILVTAHPILVGPLSYYLLKEPLSRRNISGIFLSFSGVIILVYGNYGFSLYSTDILQGNLLAFFGGIAAGLYILGGRFLRKNISVITYAFVVYAVGSIVLFFITLISNSPFFGLSMRDLGIIALMAVISGIFGHTLYNWSLAHLRASVASVALLGEPIASSVFALIIPWIQQVPSIFTVIGGAIILSGIYLTVQKK